MTEPSVARQRKGPKRRVVTLRRWLLAGVAVLMVVLAGYFGYQARRLHRALEKLPGQLGIDVRSEANGITYTQSVKGRVLFTVHASKEIQRQNGKTTLHDVSIAVKGRPGTNRTDSIRGDEFEYDQANGVVKAVGDVHIDLAAPDTKSNGKKPNATRIEVTTRGLILLQKLGVVATEEPLQFVYGDLHGSAHGADYDADTGMLRLRSDVLLDGVRNGKQIHLVAADAQLDRVTQLVTLDRARVQTGEDRAAGDRLVLSLSKDGDVQAVEGEGNVAVDTTNGSHIRAARLHATLNDDGQLQQLVANGNVQMSDARYAAASGIARVHFNAAGQPLEAELSDAVQVRTQGTEGNSSSELKAPHAVIHLVSPGKHAELQAMEADGGATVRTVQQAVVRGKVEGAGTSLVRTTVLSARRLRASTQVANDARYVSSVDGQGSTHVEQTDSLGNHSTSSSDTLHALLNPPAPGAQQAALRTVEQAGNVQLTRHQVRPAGAHAGGGTDDSRATAQRAVWDAATGNLDLTGDPVVSGTGLQLAADHIVLSQADSGAQAQGNVRGTLQGGKQGAEPLHVLAAQGRVVHGGSGAEFDGDAHPVRLWTGTAQLEAMHVEVDRDRNVLVAGGGSQQPSADVRLFLVGQQRADPSRKPQAAGPTVVTGRQLTITGAAGQEPTRVETTGNVHLVTATTDLRANRLVAVMKQSAAAPSNAVAGLLQGSGGLSSLTATGDVQLRQPGRLARGNQLLYTASDDTYRLNGTASVPPTLHDTARGDITGSSLVFHGTGDRVEITQGDGRQVHTELPTGAVRPR